MGALHEAAPQLDQTRLRLAMNDWAKASGIRLRERRKQFRMNQEQLASLAGVRHTAISKFELGLAVPKESVKIAIAFALSCNVVDIWEPLDNQYVWAVARPIRAVAA